MYVFGPVSSIFDFLTFFVLFGVFKLSESTFQTGWFLESLATQVLVIHVIRTRKIPFFQSRASLLLTVSTVSALVIGWLIPLTPLGRVFQFSMPPLRVLVVIAGLVIVYLVLVGIIKRIFYKRVSF